MPDLAKKAELRCAIRRRLTNLENLFPVLACALMFTDNISDHLSIIAEMFRSDVKFATLRPTFTVVSLC